MSENEKLSRALLFDLKRDGLTDATIAAKYATSIRAVALAREQHGVPGLAEDVMPRRRKVSRQAGSGVAGRPGVEGISVRTTDVAEAMWSKFFRRNPNFSADDVAVKPAARLVTHSSTMVGCGASSLYDVA